MRYLEPGPCTRRFTLSPSALSLGHEAEIRLTMIMAQMNGGVLSDAVDADCAHACMKGKRHIAWIS
jgi:hypothetical protein